MIDFIKNVRNNLIERGREDVSDLSLDMGRFVRLKSKLTVHKYWTLVDKVFYPWVHTRVLSLGLCDTDKQYACPPSPKKAQLL